LSLLRIPGRTISFLNKPVSLLALLLMLNIQAALPAQHSPGVEVGEIIQRGLVDCFDAGLKTADGEPVYCEASAVAFDGSHIILASDKAIPGRERSSVFTVNYLVNGALGSDITYLRAAPFLTAVKYEDMTQTPDGAYVIATTAFDRVKTDTALWDGYNTILLWPVGKPDAVSIVAASQHDGVISSVSLREEFARVLSNNDFPRGMPYFKVEAVAAIPGQVLLFGIREAGLNYRKFSYTSQIIAVPYSIEKGVLHLTGKMRLIYAFEPSANSMIPQATGLSSIEYDPYHKRLYLLTSYELNETDEGLGAYLWVLPMIDLHAGKLPTLVLNANGRPLQFAHKSEGLAVLGNRLLFIINDDDHALGHVKVSDPATQFSKAPHQSAYTLVSLTQVKPDNASTPNASSQVATRTAAFPHFYRVIIIVALVIALWLAWNLFKPHE